MFLSIPADVGIKWNFGTGTPRLTSVRLTSISELRRFHKKKEIFEKEKNQFPIARTLNGNCLEMMNAFVSKITVFFQELVKCRSVFKLIMRGNMYYLGLF